MSIFIEGDWTIISIDYSKVDNNLKEDFYIQILFQSQNPKAQYLQVVFHCFYSLLRYHEEYFWKHQ